MDANRREWGRILETEARFQKPDGEEAASIDSVASNAYIPFMSTTLTIRNLDAVVKHKLRQQAALHQRSMEAEAREILARGVGVHPPTEAANGETPRERMRKALDSVSGIWAGRGSTAEMMEITRGDDCDDAYIGP